MPRHDGNTRPTTRGDRRRRRKHFGQKGRTAQPAPWWDHDPTRPTHPTSKRKDTNS